MADPLAAARALPPGSGVIYRAFGAADAVQTGLALRRIATAGKLVLLAGADEALARAIRADGVHLPERLIGRTPMIRARHPLWIVTAAAHSSMALRRIGRAGADAALLSPALASRSPSAGRPIGSARLAIWITRAAIPVVALGGVSNETAPGLIRTGAHGLAAVEGLSP